MIRNYSRNIVIALIYMMSHGNTVYADMPLEMIQAQAEYHLIQNNYDESLELWNQVLKEDPENQNALLKIKMIHEDLKVSNKKTLTRDEERGILSMREADLGDSISQYPHTRMQKTDVGQHALSIHQRFDHNIAIAYNKQLHNFMTVPERETFDIQESIRLRKRTKEHAFELVASHEYEHADTREDYRIRHATAVLDYKNRVRLVVGDTSTYLSRFVFNGLNFRGISLSMKNKEGLAYGTFSDFIGETKMVAGVVPYFDTDAEDFIYPYNLYGIKQKVRLANWYQFGVALGTQDHEAKVTRIDEFNPKRNTVASFNQHVFLSPNWSIDHESAFSFTDDNTQVTRSESPTKRGHAHYVESNYRTERIRLLNRYEYGDKNFRSFLGTPRFLHSRTLTDREIITNLFTFEPIDNIIFDTSFNRFRNNVSQLSEVETSKTTTFKYGVKFFTKNRDQSVAIRNSYRRYRDIPGSEPVIPNQRTTRDLSVEYYKRLEDFDYRINYIRDRTFEDQDIEYFPTYTDQVIFTATSPVMWGDIMVNYLYRIGFSQMRIQDDWSKYYNDHEFDVNVATHFFRNLNVSMGYNHFNRSSRFEVEQPDIGAHTFSGTLSWPMTKTFKNGRRLTASPTLALKHVSKHEVTDSANYQISFRMNANFYFDDLKRLSLTTEYNDGIDHSIFGYGDEEFRMWLVFRHAFGL